ncbi:hypothetical protein HKBW3S06_00275 [Candidatus Hakubella thermalkaliphila]|uniref:Helix-turn-helix domain-containing protein n=1 Tax=Candidatus Hakubella thermalkaliphila TaxID=2754717 RepID=A0A6V8QBD6_9ACTN|nr:helix-turn-helix domain-containing protein [Candidatus Hakubella thermalkaliphila]GFP21049.1 hypothetical protein HKBW3S06_00275 [Candidatus Hakubella thermalkaliphila]GFP42089.1 hypothetical protein HKBW3C_01215 [Candidatus Hakubella thermalkaliphila]
MVKLAEQYPKLYTVEEVAQLLRMSPSGLRGMIREGKIHAIKAGKRYLIPQTVLDHELGLQYWRAVGEALEFEQEARRESNLRPDGSQKPLQEHLEELAEWQEKH